ncbi:hypothetical protein [Bremerella alba]|uniref:Secreted protein n=1 Tax=Bremerella alba TaxID=980252 RepID=A0A7V8V814_9BACT|nr:hypothetical protein [Bremerella alba]MBA2116608.1 hypothetical protein [Bremerella alba]
MVRIFYTLTIVSILATSPAWTWAGSPVQFDIGYLTPANEVTTAEFKNARPGYRLLQMDLMISTMVDSRVADDLVETTFFVELHNPRIQIEDFSPQTTLQSPYAGNISKENRTEFDLNGKLSANERLTDTLGADATLGFNRKQATVEKMDILPDLKLVAASGTIHRGRGVYFRFNRTNQTSLEGTTLLGIVLAVPENWSADTMSVRCRAKIRQSVVPGAPSKETELPESQYTVAIYQAGDRYAAEVAERYIQQESQWLQTKREYDDEIHHRRKDSPLDYLTSIVRPSKPIGSVDQWLARSPKQATRELPPPVVDAYYQFQQAKSLMDSCNGNRPLAKSRVSDESAIANSPITIELSDD